MEKSLKSWPSEKRQRCPLARSLFFGARHPVRFQRESQASERPRVPVLGTDGEVDACMHAYGIRRRPLWTTAACSPRLECLAKARSRSGCSSFVDCRAPHARLRWHAAGGRWRRASAQCQCHRAGRSIDRELGMARCFGPVCKQQQLVGAGLELAAPPNWAACSLVAESS